MDYIDKYSISVCTKKQITAQEVYDMIFLRLSSSCKVAFQYPE